VTRGAARLQYGDGLSREPALIILRKGSREWPISGAGRVSSQNGKAGEYANEFDPPSSFHCDNVICARMLIGIQEQIKRPLLKKKKPRI
jgi:hypothetical protein